MSTDTQLATQPAKTPIIATERGVQLDSLASMWRFAEIAVSSAIYKDIPSPAVALIKIQAGAELGLTPVWSLTNIMVVNGRPSVWGDALLGIVLAHPECEDVIETFDDKTMTATCDVRRKGRLPIVRTFSADDAKRAGLSGKQGPHTQYPKRMISMRARAFACRDAFADALRGLGVREELETVEPRQVTGRVVATNLVLPDDPEPEPPKIEPSDNDGTDPNDHSKGPELF